MVLITIVNEVYKPTYNWGAPHSRNRFIGGTYIPYILGLFFRPIFREYSPKIWPEIWYSTSILGS